MRVSQPRPQQSQPQSPASHPPPASVRQTGSFQKFFEPIFLTTLLYPLKRIQSNLQLKPSYVNPEISQCKQFLTRCTHYGLRSWWRGLTPYFVKLVVPYTMFHLFEGPARNMARNGQKVSEAMVALFKGLGLAIGYAVVFPFENARVRMGADIERDRVYRNIRDCLDKMKKTEGKSSFYRGFSLSLLHVQLQYFLASTMYQQASNPESSPVPLPPSLTGFPLFLATFLVSELLLYPLDTARKLLQINGALNHNSVTPRYRDVLRVYKIGQFYRGVEYKVLGGLGYFTVLMAIDKYRASEEEKRIGLTP